jgi:hypothetical protein
MRTKTLFLATVGIGLAVCSHRVQKEAGQWEGKREADLIAESKQSLSSLLLLLAADNG